MLLVYLRRSCLAKCVCYITTSYFSAVFSLRTWSQDCVHSQYTILCLYHDTKYIMESWISLSLSISRTPSPSPSLPLSLSISPAPSPFVVLILCRASYTYWRVAVAIISSSLFIAILHTSELCSRKYHLLHLPTMSLSSVSPSYCVLGYYLWSCW